MSEGDAPAARCEMPGCPRPVVHGDQCFEHLDRSEMPALAERMRGGEQLNASHATILSAQLAALLEALQGDDGLPKLVGANFRGARFEGVANFRAATIGSVIFGEATFEGGPNFSGVGFTDSADFGSARFEDGASFAGVTFGGSANFDGATFGAHARFAHADFVGDAFFTGAVFGGDANFSEATFEAAAHFAQTTFERGAGFREVRFGEDAVFRAATFRRARQLGPLAGAGTLMLDDSLFADRVVVEVVAAAVSGQATTFAAGAHLRVCRAEIELDNADFARPSTLSGVAAMSLSHRHDAGDDDPGPHPLPRLVSLRGAHVASLALSDLDLAACRFFGAHGLESLSIGANCVWLRGPSGRGSREMLAEEHLWRANDASSDLRPPQIAALYRSLRKAREDGKDEAGASDLYFGEMEMRRHGAAKRSDRAVLTLYHLISGYGLRAGRALATLLVAVVAASFALWAWGFEDAPSYTRALFVAVESTSSLLRTPDTHGLVATYAGEVIQIVLRLLGPLLIGLALLAVRARVKR